MDRDSATLDTPGTLDVAYIGTGDEVQLRGGLTGPRMIAVAFPTIGGIECAICCWFDPAAIMGGVVREWKFNSLEIPIQALDVVTRVNPRYWQIDAPRGKPEGPAY